ncbi:MAG: sodium pump decarboxylase subunit gamma [Desulforhopalus sp.]|jgi:sodium pump decarboxylase gamma subunit|nr:sodium pump decarboxylase subunit gamma [Desulforhopalus sp.]
MIFEGVKLMVVGMTTVMLFLLLMILFINVVAMLTRGVTARELDAIEEERKLQALNRKKAKEATSQDADEDIAVIAAAVAAYEVERFAQA